MQQTETIKRMKAEIDTLSYTLYLLKDEEEPKSYKIIKELLHEQRNLLKKEAI